MLASLLLTLNKFSHLFLVFLLRYTYHLPVIPWLTITSCLISEFQISGRTSETLDRGFKLLAEDLDIRLGVPIWICRLVVKSSVEALGIRYLVQEHRPRIWGLSRHKFQNLKSRVKSSVGYQDPRPRVSDVRSDIWNSDIRQDIAICWCILIISIFFYLVNLRTRFDETLGQISAPKNLD